MHHQQSAQSEKQQQEKSSTLNKTNSNILKIPVINQSKHHLLEYQSFEASGVDLVANIDSNIVLHPQDRTTVTTGLYLQIPPGYEAQIRPRSGLAKNHGISIPNSPGTIDADYRGEIKVILVNLSKQKYVIKDGDRIAQLVFQNVTKIQWNEVSSISSTDQSNQGFGSTGTSDTNNNKMAPVIKIDKRLIIDDNHCPSYQDLITAVDDYCPNINNNSDNISSQKEIDADFKINKADVISKNSDFIPFQFGRDSLVKTAVNELAPNETELPIKPTPIVQL